MLRGAFARQTYESLDKFNSPRWKLEMKTEAEGSRVTGNEIADKSAGTHTQLSSFVLSFARCVNVESFMSRGGEQNCFEYISISARRNANEPLPTSGKSKFSICFRRAVSTAKNSFVSLFSQTCRIVIKLIQHFPVCYSSSSTSVAFSSPPNEKGEEEGENIFPQKRARKEEKIL